MQVSLLLRNIPFEVERTICSRANELLGRRPSSAPFLSGDTFRAMADHIFDETRSLDPASVGGGSIVFVGARRLGEFEAAALPRIDSAFVLATHQGDLNVDGSFRRIADDRRISHWFAQNCLLDHPKVTPLPIGLEDRWRHNNGEYSDFRRLARRAGPSIPRIAFGFTLGTNLERRIECYRAMKSCAAASELQQPMNSAMYRNELRRYMMVASPPGNGLDCHRTWEAMYLGCVPIVEDNYMNRSFRDAGAPMVLVGSWSEVAGWGEADVERLYSDCMAKRDESVLYSDYWRAAFRGKALG